jgi:predicted enzyme related to lactoylglutathione lyase
MRHAIHWFEIAVADLDRATRFYETLLDVKLRREEQPGSSMAIFPYTEPGVGGGLVRDPHRAPGAGGTVVYLDADGKLDACIARAGAALVLPRTDIGPAGFIALIKDPDGNVVGLHSER